MWRYIGGGDGSDVPAYREPSLEEKKESENEARRASFLYDSPEYKEFEIESRKNDERLQESLSGKKYWKAAEAAYRELAAKFKEKYPDWSDQWDIMMK